MPRLRLAEVNLNLLPCCGAEFSEAQFGDEGVLCATCQRALPRQVALVGAVGTEEDAELTLRIFERWCGVEFNHLLSTLLAVDLYGKAEDLLAHARLTGEMV